MSSPHADPGPELLSPATQPGATDYVLGQTEEEARRLQEQARRTEVETRAVVAQADPLAAYDESGWDDGNYPRASCYSDWSMRSLDLRVP